MVVEADEATAPSCACRTPSPSSPTSIPSISTITALSKALRDAFTQFIENVPFYGFACLCVDHPEVQALIPRVSDRKIVTYGSQRQADVRAANLKLDQHGADSTW